MYARGVSDARNPPLNGVIKALEKGKTAFVGFALVHIESAAALTGAPYDGVAFEMEHAPMSAPRSFAVLEQGRKLARRD
jgi:hypothetical protein